MVTSVAGQVPKSHIESTLKTAINHLLIDVSNLIVGLKSLWKAMSDLIMLTLWLLNSIRICVVEGLEKKEKTYNKTAASRAIRSRSPTLRKTETQDIYRTFVDLPEG